MNKVILIGNLTKPPELRHTPDGIPVCTFSLAVNRRGKDKQADFVSVVAWRTLGENCAKYLDKGKKCAVCGELRSSSYEKDGARHFKLEVMAGEVQFLTPREAPDIPEGFTEIDDDGEFPF